MKCTHHSSRLCTFDPENTPPIFIGTKFLTAGLVEIGILLRDRTGKNVIVKPTDIPLSLESQTGTARSSLSVDQKIRRSRQCQCRSLRPRQRVTAAAQDADIIATHSSASFTPTGVTATRIKVPSDTVAVAFTKQEFVDAAPPGSSSETFKRERGDGICVGVF
ncbi:hypothetical protein EVAR_51337_1 [Eumeta japonica]|uniref:Uncharacterized protein n=1 Tax=Eumeta variegata TaxID=151549 RepID=A0A4C1XY78_EUMVA|nr:hypothetical protein EVAR_51337_1 [Eumeta japonica]